jgi:hypothetical protein
LNHVRFSQARMLSFGETHVAWESDRIHRV